MFSVALSLIASGFRRIRPVGVTHHRVLSCSDFPPALDRSHGAARAGDRLATSSKGIIGEASERRPSDVAVFLLDVSRGRDQGLSILFLVW